MIEASPEAEAFDRLLAAEPGAWAAANRSAFARLCEAFPGPSGPTARGLRQLERGHFDARVPPDWKPVFVEVYHQWLGFAQDQELVRPAPTLSPGWWFQGPRPLRRLPPVVRHLVSPGGIAGLVLGLAAWRCAEGIAIRTASLHELRVVAASAEQAGEELAESERAARSSLASASDAMIASFLATEPTLRSRFESASARDQELAAALERAQATLEASRFPRWPVRGEAARGD